MYTFKIFIATKLVAVIETNDMTELKEISPYDYARNILELYRSDLVNCQCYLNGEFDFSVNKRMYRIK